MTINGAEKRGISLLIAGGAIFAHNEYNERRAYEDVNGQTQYVSKSTPFLFGTRLIPEEAARWENADIFAIPLFAIGMPFLIGGTICRKLGEVSDSS
ncbi:MAG: hypothetical protein ABH864_06595 [archaeon]